MRKAKNEQKLTWFFKSNLSLRLFRTKTIWVFYVALWMMLIFIGQQLNANPMSATGIFFTPILLIIYFLKDRSKQDASDVRIYYFRFLKKCVVYSIIAVPLLEALFSTLSIYIDHNRTVVLDDTNPLTVLHFKNPIDLPEECTKPDYYVNDRPVCQ